MVKSLYNFNTFHILNDDTVDMVICLHIGSVLTVIIPHEKELEPPLAHMIPELTSNLLLPIAIFVWMLAIDWRMGLAVLIAPVLAMIPMFFLMRNYNSQYAAYMEAMAAPNPQPYP